MSTTITWRRQELGLSREELAERVGVTAHMVERWEEIGLDAEPGSRLGDLFIGKVMDALEIEEGLIFPCVPDSPKPGDLIITPGSEAGTNIEGLVEHSEELDIRISVPDRFGLSLKPLKEVTGEDYAAIGRHFDRERAYSESVVRRMESTLEMLGGNSGEWREGQTMQERLDEVSREMGEDLDREARGGE